MINVDRQQYLKDSRKRLQLMNFGVALEQRLPKKCHSKIVPLLKAYPQLCEIRVLETNTAILGILWQCPAGESHGYYS